MNGAARNRSQSADDQEDAKSVANDSCLEVLMAEIFIAQGNSVCHVFSRKLIFRTGKQLLPWLPRATN